MNWQYIAGFFDGEGSITHNGSGFRISIPQTNELVLQRIRTFSKMGSIVKVTKRQAHWKDSWTYYISRQEDVYLFLGRISPFLIVKRAAAYQALHQLKGWIKVSESKQRLYQRRKLEAKSLKALGWNYRAIGKKLHIDWGYARRLALDLA